MTEATPARKSRRQRIPNKKYLNDGLEVLNAVLSSDSEDEEILQRQLLQDDSDEFSADQLVEEQEEEEGEADDDSVVEDVSEGSEILTPVEEYEDAQSYASSEGVSPCAPKIPQRRNQHFRDPDSRSRGMPENPFRKDVMRDLFNVITGEGEEDISLYMKSRNQWAADQVLPRRSQLRHAFSHTEEKRQMEATVGWDWYYDQGGHERFAKRQMVQDLTLNEISRYVGSTSSDHEFIMGPYGKQIKFSLALSQAMELDQAWQYPADVQSQSTRRRHGWMLNVGTRVKCLDWAPNHDGSVQYLALATASLPIPTHSLKEPPAFTPLAGPTAIQIWAVSTSTERDSVEKPFIRMLLCTDWGEIKQMKWCPVPRSSRDQDEFPSQKSVGLLAAVFADGHARVLDVQLDQRGESSTTFQTKKYTSAAFEVPPQANNLNTCLTWLSATDLAIGDSSGHLAIYDICPEANPTASDSPEEDTGATNNAEHEANPSPWLSIQLHSTYMLAIASAYPTNPSLLMSSSLSGYLRLTSLLAPTMDYVLSNRIYTPPSTLSYSPAVLSCVWAEEMSETVRLSALRCFYASVAFEKMHSPPGPGPAIVDAGRCHSSVVAGGADGSVFVSNPHSKFLGNKTTNMYQQCIFKHEWRRIAPGSEEQGPQRRGMSRITEGYLPEKVYLGPKAKPGGKAREKVQTSTIYEEETAVTAVAWNHNVSCGGWLAVGWGSGLVRIQDVALD